MANKRIELERYKYFVRMGDEEPNRKRSTTGAYISMITAMLLVAFFLVLGAALSSDQAVNSSVVLETPVPTLDESSGETINEDYYQDTQTIDFVTPTEQEDSQTPAQSIAPENDWNKTLLAQAEPAEEEEETMPEVEVQTLDVQEVESQETQPEESEETVPEETEPTGPSQQTKGIGNLANLATFASNRGFQIYILIVTIALLTIIYMALSRIRRQRKIK